jgi:AraC-like DNA-binding protein
MERRIIGRPEPDKLPELTLPLYVRSVGYNEAPFGWSEFFPAKRKRFTQVFWCLKGSGDFTIGGRRLRLKQDEIIYHLPGEDHIHSAASEFWAYHWFTLDGPLAADFLKGYGFPQRPIPAGPCPVDMFLQLESLMREMSPRSQRRMLSVATEILAKAGNHSESGGRAQEIVDHFIELARTNFRNPMVNVNAMAGMLNIHRTTLDRLFKGQMLMNPGEYLMKLRIQHALSLLRETEKPIFEVGELCGIPNRGYFCKLIRHATGTTPKAYRERTAM